MSEVKFNKRLLFVWLILAALTLAYLWIDHSAGGLLTSSAVVTSSFEA